MDENILLCFRRDENGYFRKCISVDGSAGKGSTLLLLQKNEVEHDRKNKNLKFYFPGLSLTQLFS